MPSVFPSLLRAEKVLKRASKFGVKSENLSSEIATLQERLMVEENKQKIAGELLLKTVELLSSYGVESETALKGATQNFIDDFLTSERKVIADGLTVESLDKEQIKRYFNNDKTN